MRILNSSAALVLTYGWRAGATQNVKSDILETKCLEEILILDKYTFNQHEEMRNQNHQEQPVSISLKSTLGSCSERVRWQDTNTPPELSDADWPVSREGAVQKSPWKALQQAGGMSKAGTAL